MVLPLVLLASFASASPSVTGWYHEVRDEVSQGLRENDVGVWVPEREKKETHWMCYRTRQPTTLEAHIIFDGVGRTLEPDPLNKERFFAENPFACFQLPPEVFHGWEYEMGNSSGYRNGLFSIRGFFPEEQRFTSASIFYTCNGRVSRDSSCAALLVEKLSVPPHSPTLVQGTSAVSYLTFQDDTPSQMKAYAVVRADGRTFPLQVSGMSETACGFLVPQLFMNAPFDFYAQDNDGRTRSYSYTELIASPSSLSKNDSAMKKDSSPRNPSFTNAFLTFSDSEDAHGMQLEILYKVSYAASPKIIEIPSLQETTTTALFRVPLKILDSPCLYFRAVDQDGNSTIFSYSKRGHALLSVTKLLYDRKADSLSPLPFSDYCN